MRVDAAVVVPVVPVLLVVAVVVFIVMAVVVFVGVAVAVLVGMVVAVLVGVVVAILIGVAVAILIGVAVAILIGVVVAILVGVVVTVLVGVVVAVLVVGVIVLVGVVVTVLVVGVIVLVGVVVTVLVVGVIVLIGVVVTVLVVGVIILVGVVVAVIVVGEGLGEGAQVHAVGEREDRAIRAPREVVLDPGEARPHDDQQVRLARAADEARRGREGVRVAPHGHGGAHVHALAAHLLHEVGHDAGGGEHGDAFLDALVASAAVGAAGGVGAAGAIGIAGVAGAVVAAAAGDGRQRQRAGQDRGEREFREVDAVHHRGLSDSVSLLGLRIMETVIHSVKFAPRTVDSPAARNQTGAGEHGHGLPRAPRGHGASPHRHAPRRARRHRPQPAPLHH